MKNKTGLMLVLVALVCMAGARANAENPADWSFSVETSGEDVSWTSTTRVHQAFPAYDFVYDLNQVEVDVAGTGWTDYSSEFESTAGEGASYEGLPMGLMSYNHDVNGLTASIWMNIDEDGYAHLSVANVVFGQWNGQDIQGLRIGGTITVVGLKELWADDFCYNVVDGMLDDTASWTDTNRKFKIGGEHDGRAYYYNYNFGDPPYFATVDGVGSLYDPNNFRIKAEGYIREDTDPCTHCKWFVLGRVSGPNHIRVGAVLAKGTPEQLSMRVGDTGGYADGDYYVGAYSPTQPFIIELIFNNNIVKGRVSHLGNSASATFTTTVTSPGAPGLGGWFEHGYALGYFDNFGIYTNSAVNPAQCGDQGTVYPDADLNKDCRIDFADFAEIVLAGAAQAVARAVNDVNIADRADYTVEAEAWEHPDRKIAWYVAGRITETTNVRLGAALSIPDDANNRYVYGRIVDSNGSATRCNWVADYDPDAPIYLKLTLNGDVAAGAIAHNGGTQTISIITDVLNTGAPGIGGYNCGYDDGSPNWLYAVGRFDNFKVSVPACGDPGIPCDAGDINQDCYVNMLDVAEFVTKWLECTDPADANCDQYWK